MSVGELSVYNRAHFVGKKVKVKKRLQQSPNRPTAIAGRQLGELEGMGLGED